MFSPPSKRLENGNVQVSYSHPPEGIGLPVLDSIEPISMKVTVTRDNLAQAEGRLIEISSKDFKKLLRRLDSQEELSMYRNKASKPSLY